YHAVPFISFVIFSCGSLVLPTYLVVSHTASFRAFCERFVRAGVAVKSVHGNRLRIMSAPEFDSAHAKVNRAREHSERLASLWNEYLEQSPFGFSLVDDGPNRWILRATQSEPLPETMSVIFGEWLFNLRSALDSLIWATAVHISRTDPPPKESALQYPIYDSLDQWK